MTEETRAAKIRALLRERDGYAARGQDDRVAAVDAELLRLGAQGSPKAVRAVRR